MADLPELEAFQDGRIRWYSVGKQYGFVITDDGAEIFLHHNSIVYPGSGACNHNRGICARAMSLLSDEKQREELLLQANGEFNTRRFEKLLEGVRVTFRVARTERGPGVRSLKRAT